MDSPTFAELAASLRYGGHGLLWPAVVFAVTRVCGHPIGMALAHAALATAAAWLWFRHAPFTRRTRLLVGFGYYLSFEYALISRPYALGVLFLFGALGALVRPRPRLWVAAGCLAALAHTTVYGVILGAAIAAATARDWLSRRGAVPALAAAAAAALAVWRLRPPPDEAFASWRWLPAVNAVRDAFGALARGVLPLPRPGPHFWNTHLFDAWPWLLAVLGGAILLMAWRAFRSHPRAGACWLVAAGGLLIFMTVKFLGQQRHAGQVALALLASAWLAQAPDRGGAAGAAPLAEAPSLRRRRLMTAVLSLQAVAGLYASAMDWGAPFSAASAAARFIRAQGYADRLIVADADHLTLPVLALLDRPEVLLPRSGARRRLVEWNRRRLCPFGPAALWRTLDRETNHGAKPVLVLLTYPLHHLQAPLRLVATFGPGVVANERYYLYAN